MCLSYFSEFVSVSMQICQQIFWSMVCADTVFFKHLSRTDVFGDTRDVCDFAGEITLHPDQVQMSV